MILVASQIYLMWHSYHRLNKTNSATLINDRYKGKFASPNIVNLYWNSLTSNDISLLSKGLKFFPTPRAINEALIKEELETYGRNLDLCGIFVVMRGSLVMIVLRKNLSLILKERMQLLLNYI